MNPVSLAFGSKDSVSRVRLRSKVSTDVGCRDGGVSWFRKSAVGMVDGSPCFQTIHVTPNPTDALILPCDPVQCDLRKVITHSRPTSGFMAQKFRLRLLSFESPNTVLSGNGDPK